MTKARMARTAARGGTGSIRQDERHATMVDLVPLGLGGVAALVGLVPYLAGRLSTKGADRRGALMALGVLALALMATGCGTVRVPMAPHVGKVAIERPLPLEAALLIPEDRQSYIFRGKPASFTGSAREHEFALGPALDIATLAAFSQVFEKVTPVRSQTEAAKFKVAIEPTIENFHFRYDQLSYGGFAIAAVSKIRVRTTLTSGETKVWERVVESPEQRQGPWVVDFDFKNQIGNAASGRVRAQ
jgi:hypothetical protein